MNKIRYGVEVCVGNKSRVKMFNVEQKAEATLYAEQEASKLNGSGVVSMFYAECGENGRPISSEMHVMNVWEA